MVAAGTVRQPQRILIQSMGARVQVPNPDWDGTTATPQTITRDYSFGAAPGHRGSWRRRTAPAPTLNVIPAGLEGRTDRGRGPDQSGPRRLSGGGDARRGAAGGVAAGRDPHGRAVQHPARTRLQQPPLRRAPSRAYGPTSELYAVRRRRRPIRQRRSSPPSMPPPPGDLILVPPGTYDELAGDVEAGQAPGLGRGCGVPQRPPGPHREARRLAHQGREPGQQRAIDLLPGQELAPTGFPALGAPLFPTEEGAGIFVAGKQLRRRRLPAATGQPGRAHRRVHHRRAPPRAAASCVNGYAGYMSIGNNRLIANAGFYGGGIRVGHPTLSHEDPTTDRLVYDDAVNDNVRIHHNQVDQERRDRTRPGSAAVSASTPAPTTTGSRRTGCAATSARAAAPASATSGFSNNGLIEDNTIIFNESFSQATARVRRRHLHRRSARTPAHPSGAATGCWSRPAPAP